MAILRCSRSGSLAALALLALVGCRDETGSGGAGGGGTSSSSGDGGASTTTTTTTGTTSTSTTSTTTATTTGTGGAGTGGAGTGGAGGGPECTTPSDCGTDGDCETFTCTGGVCDSVFPALGTPTTVDTPDDCQLDVCDGSGSTTTEDDDTDVEDDLNDCTTDTCISGVPDHEPVAEGDSCVGPNGETLCNAVGECVECLSGSDCTSLVCTAQFTCAGAGCMDNVMNGGETDVDCGGPDCADCATGDGCLVDGDCESGLCTAFVCAPTCFDGVMNQNETAIDCGGPCGGCPVGDPCVVADDCLSGTCTALTCGEYQILISEFRPRGPGSGSPAAGMTSDDFIELYNPLTLPVTLTADMEVLTRSDTALAYSSRFTGAGQVLPAHGHLLIAGSLYTGTVTPDSQGNAGIVPDKASVVVRRGTVVLDAVCEYCGVTDPFLGDATYFCEGTPFVFTGCTSNNSDRSLERKLGGVLGNGIDTGSSANDFQIVNPSNPQNLMSAPTP